MSEKEMPHAKISRRRVLGTLAGLGIGTVAWRRALALQVAEQGAVTAEMLKQAEWISGVELSEEDRETTAQALRGLLRNFAALRAVEIRYDVASATWRHGDCRPASAVGRVAGGAAGGRAIGGN